MSKPKVYILTFNVDLGVSIEGVYQDPEIPHKIAKQNNEKDRISWIGADGNTYTSSDHWYVQEHDVDETQI